MNDTLVFLLLLLVPTFKQSEGFSPAVAPRRHGFDFLRTSKNRQQQQPISQTILRFRDEEFDHDVTLPDLATMKNSELREECKSYGIVTKAFLEKSDFVKALEKARAEGKKPLDETTSQPKQNNSEEGAKQRDTNPGSSSSSSDFESGTRDDRYNKALQYAKGMKAKTLKQALEDWKIPTKTLLDKSDLEKAYATAVADNIQKKKETKQQQQQWTSASASTGTSTKTRTEHRSTATSNEPYDHSYRDVHCVKFDPSDVRGHAIIDI